MTVRKEAASGAGNAVFSRRLEYPGMEEMEVTDITAEVARAVRDSGLSHGVITVFVPGATGVITCLEYEPGVIADFRDAVERLAPRDIPYQHNVFQADGNGHSHVRAGLVGPSLTVPFVNGELTLGVWQQVVLVNCDNRRRDRHVVLQAVGA